MTTLIAPPNSLQASLIAALSDPKGQPERSLEQAFIQLSRGGEVPLLLAMVKALVRIGLAGIAVRLLNAGGGLLTTEPQIAALAEQLAVLPTGELSHDSLRNNLQAQVESLLRTHPQLQQLARQLKQIDPAVHIYRSNTGTIQALRHGTNGRLEFVFSFADHRAHAQAAAIPNVDINTSFQLIGVPSVPLWKRLVALKTASGFRPPIDLIETDVGVFALWLSLLDGTDVWGDERVRVYVGPDAPAQQRYALMNQSTRMPAVHTVTSHRPGWKPPITDRTAQESLVEAIATRRRNDKRRIDQHYEKKDVRYWRDRFASAGTRQPPLRVVGFTTRYSTVMQYSMRDLASAFRRAGCEFHVVMQPNEFTPAVDVTGAIEQHRPDMIVVINHLRKEYTDSIPRNVPFVCWIQDHMQPLWSKDAGQSVGELELVAGHGRDVMVSLYGYPADRFLATSNLTASDVFSAEPISPQELESYRCDVSYVGHGSELPQQLVNEMAGDNQSLRKYLHTVLQSVNDRLQDHDSINTMELIELVLQAEQSSGHPSFSPEVRRAAIIPAAQRLYDRVLRHQSMEWAADWATSRGRSLRIYGRGWEHHPTLRSFAQGEIEHGEPLRRLYQASAISLQINGYSSLHQRLLDGLASGACMVSRYNPSDFIRKPHEFISTYIKQHKIHSIQELLRQAESNADLRDALQDAERLIGTRLAPINDPTRARHVRQHLACASMAASEFTDDGLLRVLREMISIPPRTAGDITGFASATFRNKAQLHDLLDELVDDPAARKSRSFPMRENVLAYDTYDVLTGRLLTSFAFVRPTDNISASSL